MGIEYYILVIILKLMRVSWHKCNAEWLCMLTQKLAIPIHYRQKHKTHIKTCSDYPAKPVYVRNQSHTRKERNTEQLHSLMEPSFLSSLSGRLISPGFLLTSFHDCLTRSPTSRIVAIKIPWDPSPLCLHQTQASSSSSVMSGLDLDLLSAHRISAFIFHISQ